MENEQSSFNSVPTPPNKEGIRINFHIPIRKKILVRVIVPVLVVGLLAFGLIRQGFVADWFGGLTNASISLIVTNETNQPVENARVVIANISESTDQSGAVAIVDLPTGEQELSIQKTGYSPYKQSVTLKRGKNALGTITLKAAAVEKVTLSLSVTDYISDELITGAAIKVGDLTGSFDSGSYKIANVPVGKHPLTVSNTGYETFTSEVTIEEKTTTLDAVKLVRSGVVVFESNREGGKRGIFVANYDGSNQKNLIARVGDYEDYNPILGPNQRKLFFTSTRDGQRREGTSNEFKTYMYLVDIDGKNLTKISESSSDYAVWSPDGGFIGYTKYTEDYSKSELHTYDVVKKTSHEFSGYNSSSFSFNLDGTQIAFSGRKDGSSLQRLTIANSNGTNLKEVATDPENGFYGMEFTTAGKLRYSRYDSAAKKTKWFEYDLANSAIAEVTAPAVDREGAILSPNKKLRAYVSSRDGKRNLYVSDPDGKNERKLTDLNNVEYGLLWAKDSSFVMFNYQTPGESARYLVAVNGTAKAKKIVDVNLSYFY